MSAQHTPGPWVVEINSPYYVTTIDRGGNSNLPSVVGTCFTHADAQLIAAAPDLYEALAGWLPIAERQLARVPEEGRDSAAYAFAVERVDKSRAALAKARDQ